MKTTFFLMFIVALSVTTLAQRKNETKSPIIGSWKFSNQSAINEFQKAFENKQYRNCKTEYFTFEPNHTFKHNFIDQEDRIIKTLSGKWKSIGNKIKIEYAEIDFSFTTSYFFLDKDLVLGQNFSHVIFTKDDWDYNVVMK